MQRLAKELGVVIPVSFFEEANNAHYNSIVIIDADGSDLGIYRKSHIPDGPGENMCILTIPNVFPTVVVNTGKILCRVVVPYRYIAMY
jgi:predicted amidohydrolase